MLRIVIFIAGLIATLPVIARDDLAFPIFSRENLLIGKSAFQVGLYRTNDKSLSGFVFSVHRDGFLIKLEVMDGTSPLIISPKQYAWPNNLVGVRFGQGGHENILRFFALNATEVTEIGVISSNAACIYQSPGKSGFVEAIDENRGEITLTTYKIERTKVRKFKQVSLVPTQTEAMRMLCAEYDLK